MTPEILGQLAPHDVGAVGPQPHKAAGVEGLDAVGDAVLVQQPARGGGQRIGVAPLSLQLHHQRGLAGEDGQHLLQQGDVVLRALQPVVFQVLRRQILDLHVHTGGAQQGGVVDHGQMAVLHQVDIQLRAEAALDGAAEGGNGIFGDAGLIVEAAVGEAPLAEPLPVLTAAAAQAQRIQQTNKDQQAQQDIYDRHINPPPDLPELQCRTWAPACCRRASP